jgi:hypothetical protein
MRILFTTSLLWISLTQADRFTLPMDWWSNNITTPSSVPEGGHKRLLSGMPSADSDRAVMRDLALSINRYVPSWVDSGDPCDIPIWTGVTCDVNSCVTGITLNGRGMALDISVVQNVPTLTKINLFDVRDNFITGTLPTAFLSSFSTSNMKYVLLSGNSITGMLPCFWWTI